MLDGALDAHVLEHATHPGHQPVVGQGGQLSVEGVLDLARAEHGAGDARERRGLSGVDLDDGAAGLLQGAPDLGLQAELEHRVEQQAAADPGPHPGRDLPGPGPPPERGELLALDEVRRDDPVAAEPVVAGGGDGLVGQRVKRDRVVADRVPQQRAQRQRVRPALHEPGPVRGVLHAVGEDERLLLARVESLVAEQRRQRDRQQGGDRAAEEADAVLLLARRAGVVLGLVVGVGTDQGEHGQHPAVAVVRVVVGGRR